MAIETKLSRDLPTPADILAAAETIRPYVRTTPVLRTEIGGRVLLMKLENLQRSGSFKLRGATNALLSGRLPQRVVTASGGNHGLAVATAAATLHLPAVVYVPRPVPEGKARRIEAAGAKLVRHGDTYAEAASAALAEASDPGTRYVHAYDDPAVVAGQGSVAAEVLADAPDVDAFFVAAGGGGLAAGTALVAGQRPTIAVEPEGCCSLHAALAAGEPVDAPVDSIASSGLGATRVGAVPFAVLTAAGAHSTLVSDDDILSARELLWEEFRLAVEPAAAVGLAGWLSGVIPARRACVIVCGANADWHPVG